MPNNNDYLRRSPNIEAYDNIHLINVNQVQKDTFIAGNQREKRSAN